MVETTHVRSVMLSKIQPATSCANSPSGISASELMAKVQLIYGVTFYEQLLAEIAHTLNFSSRISLAEHYIYGSNRLGARMVNQELYRNQLQHEGLEEPLLMEEGLHAQQPFYNPAADFSHDGVAVLDPDVQGAAQWLLHAATDSIQIGNPNQKSAITLVLDRRTGQHTYPADTVYAWYQADVSSAQDYYPFGMIMPGRTYVADSTRGYRYGFNGMEQDDEVKGSGNSYDFGARMYDVRIGMFLSIDPRWRDFPHWSPYLYAANSPIQCIDEDGEGPGLGILKWLASQTNSTFSVQTYGSIALGLVKTSAQGMAVDKNGNVALFMSRGIGTSSISAGVNGGVGFSIYPGVDVNRIPGASLNFGVQGSAYNSLHASASFGMELNEGRGNSRLNSLSMSVGLGPEASPFKLSPMISASSTTAILMSEADYSTISTGYSSLISRTNDLNRVDGSTGFYSAISSELSFIPTGQEGQFEAVLLQTYEYRPYTEGGNHQMITETISTGIIFMEDEGNLKSNNLIE